MQIDTSDKNAIRTNNNNNTAPEQSSKTPTPATTTATNSSACDNEVKKAIVKLADWRKKFGVRRKQEVVLDRAALLVQRAYLSCISARRGLRKVSNHNTTVTSEQK